MIVKDILENLTCSTNKKEQSAFKVIECKPNMFIHFWATWCSPCRNEIPELQKIYNEYNQNIDFLFISCDNNRADIDTFVTNQKLTIPIGYDTNNKISSDFNIRSIPSSFFIKRTNNNDYIVKNIIGSMDYQTLKQNFKNFYNNSNI